MDGGWGEISVFSMGPLTWAVYVYAPHPLLHGLLRRRGYRRSHTGNWYRPGRRSPAVSMRLDWWTVRTEVRALADEGFRVLPVAQRLLDQERPNQDD